ncbi:thioredoxin family protein [Verrucomicrobiota bacterium]
MPDLKMKNIDGWMLSYADIKGAKGTVVAFWCNHCPFVKKARLRFIELANTYQSEGIAFLAVNSNTPKKFEGDSFENMQKIAEQFGYPFPFVVDEGSRLALAMGGARTPHIFLFDAADKLVYVGAIDDAPGKPDEIENDWLKDAMDDLLEGRPVRTSRSKAFGCSIKFYK